VDRRTGIGEAGGGGSDELLPSALRGSRLRKRVFAVACNQAGRAGYVDTYPKDAKTNRIMRAAGWFDPLGAPL
jgi:hypothetical protein